MLKFSKQRIQHERLKVRRPCVKLLRDYQRQNLLERYQVLYWVCPPDLEKLTQRQRMAALADGYHAGVFDMTIIGGNPGQTKVWLIEFKYGKNGYTASQSTVVEGAKGTLVECLIVRNTEDFLKFIERELMGRRVEDRI